MGRKTRLAVLVVTAALLLAACGGGGSSDGAGGEGGPVRLYHDKAPWEDYFKQMGDLASSDAGITLEQTPYSDTTSYQQVIRSSFQTREIPDVFTWWSGERLGELVDAEIAADVTDVWDELVADGTLPETVKDAFTFDGKQYGLPLHVSYWSIAYNKKLFDQHGLKPPTTWDELMTAADTLKQAGVTPFYASVDGRWPSFIWFEELLGHSDPELYKAICDGEASYTDPGVVKVMETWKGMFDKGYFSPLDIPLDAAAATAFADNQFAMMPMGSWFNGTLKGAGMTPGEDYGVFVLPNLDPNLESQPIVYETAPLVVPSQAPDLERSKEFVKWFQSETAQKKWGELLSDAPTNPNVEAGDPNLTQLTEAAAADDTVLLERYWECSPPELVESAVDSFSKFMVDPASYQQVLEEVQAKAEEVWAKQDG